MECVLEHKQCSSVRTFKGCGKIMPATQLSSKAGFGTCTILQPNIDKYIHNSYEDQMGRMIRIKQYQSKTFKHFSFWLQFYYDYHRSMWQGFVLVYDPCNTKFLTFLLWMLQTVYIQSALCTSEMVLLIVLLLPS